MFHLHTSVPLHISRFFLPGTPPQYETHQSQRSRRASKPEKRVSRALLTRIYIACLLLLVRAVLVRVFLVCAATRWFLVAIVIIVARFLAGVAAWFRFRR